MRLHNSFKRRVICILTLTALLVGSAGITSNAASSKSASGIQSEINSLEAEAKKIKKEINSLKSDKKQKENYKNTLQKSINNYESQINACEKYINEYASQIDEMNSKIDSKNKELDNALLVFKKRVRYIYMNSQNSGNMSVLMGSDDQATYLTMNKFSKSVSAYDKKIMEDIKKIVADLDSKKSEVEKLKAQQDSIKQSIAVKKGQLNSQVGELNNIIQSINSETGTLNGKLAQVQKDIDNYEAEMRRLGAEASNTNAIFSGQFLWPVNGFYNISSPFGYRIHPITGVRKLHTGIDISKSGIANQPVLAAADGTVMRAEINGSLTSGYGRYVVINHGKMGGTAYTTHYAHLASYSVSAGQTVKKGQVIGRVGTSGSSTGYHLHFEIRQNGTAVNPMQFFSSTK